mmetsp:Transcript_76680/g.167517  ORF Transcript_76680/g.167517 Transcript_76680/m.167517 type:complete len:405 (+) Transcript_76680:522-1736(+)
MEATSLLRSSSHYRDPSGDWPTPAASSSSATAHPAAYGAAAAAATPSQQTHRYIDTQTPTPTPPAVGKFGRSSSSSGPRRPPPAGVLPPRPGSRGSFGEGSGRRQYRDSREHRPSPVPQDYPPFADDGYSGGTGGATSSTAPGPPAPLEDEEPREGLYRDENEDFASGGSRQALAEADFSNSRSRWSGQLATPDDRRPFGSGGWQLPPTPPTHPHHHGAALMPPRHPSFDGGVLSRSQPGTPTQHGYGHGFYPPPSPGLHPGLVPPFQSASSVAAFSPAGTQQNPPPFAAPPPPGYGHGYSRSDAGSSHGGYSPAGSGSFPSLGRLPSASSWNLPGPRPLRPLAFPPPPPVRLPQGHFPPGGVIASGPPPPLPTHMQAPGPCFCGSPWRPGLPPPIPAPVHCLR